jgi:hypothetical protein
MSALPLRHDRLNQSNPDSPRGFWRRPTYPDPSDDYLIDTLKENYSPADVKGYGGRLRRLRRDFLSCSKLRAFTLKNRLSARTRGDRLSELFHDRLSHGGRAFFSVSWGSGLPGHMQDGGLYVFLGCSFPAFSFNGRKLNRGYTFFTAIM